MEIESFIKNFAEAVEDVEPDSLSAGSEFKSLEQWDSLATISILAMVNAEYDFELSPDALEGCATIGDLFNLIQKKGE